MFPGYGDSLFWVCRQCAYIILASLSSFGHLCCVPLSQYTLCLFQRTDQVLPFHSVTLELLTKSKRFDHGLVMLDTTTNPTALGNNLSLTSCKNKSLEKVPSVVQYSKDASRLKWGFEVNPDSSNAQPALRWFKLLLNQGSDTHVSGAQRQESNINNDMQLAELHTTVGALPEDKAPVDVVTDYLRGIYQHTLDTLKKDYPESFSSRIGKETPLQFVLTVPAVCARLD